MAIANGEPENIIDSIISAVHTLLKYQRFVNLDFYLNHDDLRELQEHFRTERTAKGWRVTTQEGW